MWEKGEGGWVRGETRLPTHPKRSQPLVSETCPKLAISCESLTKSGHVATLNMRNNQGTMLGVGKINKQMKTQQTNKQQLNRASALYQWGESKGCQSKGRLDHFSAMGEGGGGQTSLNLWISCSFVDCTDTHTHTHTQTLSYIQTHTQTRTHTHTHTPIAMCVIYSMTRGRLCIASPLEFYTAWMIQVIVTKSSKQPNR